MNWQTFLNDIFLGDTEIINLMQRVVGYASTGDMTAGIVVVCHGHGRNGRSMFFQGLQLAMPEQVVFSFPDILPDSLGSERPSPLLLKLKQARMAVFEEADSISSRELPGLKRLSTDGDIVARDVWAKDLESFRNTATPFLVSSGLRPVVMSNRAFSSRLVFIPFPVRFMPGLEASNTWKKAQRSDVVLSALARDVDAIRSWIEEGARLYRANGLSIPERFTASAQTAKRVA